MELPSIQFNGISWSVFRLGESSFQLTPNDKKNTLGLIHDTIQKIEDSKSQNLIDIISSYFSMTLIFNDPNIDLISFLSVVDTSKPIDSKTNKASYRIPVCYDLGLDWKEMELATGLAKKEIVAIHSGQEYTIAMIGFLPGFIFLDGLDNRIHVSRRSVPRVSIPEGSVGVGGTQTGIYSLESPGGWQIIGRTKSTLFNVNQIPPTRYKAGEKVIFDSISEDEYLNDEGLDG